MARSCPNLPEEALEEILSWLPPETLMELKCVCKSWYALINSLIENPAFVKKHLGNIGKNNLCSTTHLVFFCSRPDYFWMPLCWPDPEPALLDPWELYSSITIFHGHNESDQLNHVSEDFHLPVLPTADMNDMFGCQCNGVICLADYHRTLVLLNPAIKKSATLPKPCLADDGFVVLGTGFGYDSRANDYKVIRFGLHRFLPVTVENPKPRAEVYSMSTDSWREIGISLEFGRFPFIDKEVFCKGVFYWPFLTRDYVIISFDLFDEVFRSISLPDNIERQGKKIKLAVWNDSLALFLYPDESEPSLSIEVWVMDDCINGVIGSCSWMKKLTIGPLAGIATPWTFWKSDELLMEAIDGGLLSYNLRSLKLRSLTIQGVDRIRSWAFRYVKSLVPVRGGNMLIHSGDMGTRIM